MYVCICMYVCIKHSFENDEIHFNLMALVSDKKRAYTREISELERRKTLAALRVRTEGVVSRGEGSRAALVFIDPGIGGGGGANGR